MLNFQVSLTYWEVFLLILVRIASFVYTAPFFSISSIPQRVKVSLSLFLSILIFMLLPDKSLEYSGILDYAILVIKESVVGLLLGFVCNVCIQTITFMGHIVDTNIGMSMASMYDPNLQSQTGVTGTLYYYMTFLLMLVSGLYQFLISAIIDSYSIIPFGAVTINTKLYSSFLEVIASYFIIGVRLSLPIFVTIMLLNVVLGILTKVAPQMHMFSIGVQLKLLLGLAVMFLTVGLLPVISSAIFNMMRQVVKSIAGGLV